MDLAIDYSTDLNPGQAGFHASTAMYKAMVGALGSGKTATGCVEGIALSLEYPGNVGLIARKTLPELKSTTLKRFFEYLPDPLVQSYNKTDRELYIRTNGEPSLVHFGPLDEIGRYKSLELGWFFIDEADEMDEDMWLLLCGRLRMKGSRYAGMLATNPTSTNHWIYRRFVLQPPPNYELFRSKTLDNAHNLPDGYVKQLRENYPDDWAKRFIDGHFGVIQSGDPCFPDFKDHIHVKTLKPIPSLKMIRGWDFGRRHPSCVFAQLDEEGGLRVYRTLLGENEDLYKFSDRVIKFSNTHFNTFVFEDYCDIAGKQERDSGKSSIAILQQDRRIFPVFRFSRPEDRVREMRKMMRQRTTGGEEMFVVDPANGYLIEGLLGGYQVDDEGKAKKDGYFEHGIDALGYIMCNTCMVESQSSEAEVSIPEPKWSMGRGA